MDNSGLLNITDNNTNNIDHLTRSEYNLIVGFKLASASLSLMGSLFIVTIYIFLSLKYKCNRKQKHARPTSHQKNVNMEVSNESSMNASNDYRKLKLGYGHDLIFHLSLADLILSISAYIKTSGFDNWSGLKSDITSACILQGVLSNFAELSSICWASTISLSIYIGTVTTNVNKIKKILFYSFFYSYGIPVVLTICPLFTGSYGPAGAWCWLNTRDSNDTAAWGWSLTIYIFNWINIIFNIFAVVKTIQYFKIRAFEVEEKDNEQSNFLKNFCIVLKFFPIIQIICWIFPTINRISIYVSDTENTALYALHAFFGFLMGFFNCIVYSYYFRSNIPCWYCFRTSVKPESRPDKESSGLGREKYEEGERDIEFIQNISELDEKSQKINEKAIKNNSSTNPKAEGDSIL